ncbi:MAG: type II secretion system F family protein [Fimbriiglobus sp.]|jgi:tight adherence protein B|nr:type II secretion system F family protein [Fimbriiglobus sp.]
MMTQAAYTLLGSLACGLAVALGSIQLVRLADRVNQGYTADLRDRMTRAGMDDTALTRWMRVRVFGAVAVWLVGWLLFAALPVGIMLGVFVYLLVPFLLERELLAQRTRIRDQLVSATRNLASQVRGGVTLVRGLTVVADQTPPPLGLLLRESVNRYHRGMAQLPEVLGELKDRLRMDFVALFTVALSTSVRKGGPIAEVLENIGNSLEENQRVERKREADTAAGRLLVSVLVAFPFVFLGLFFFLDPEGTRAVFTTLLGQLVLCGVGGLSYLALAWARKILGRGV